ncbi:unnamed protein product [Phaedon cochleariae]|uniref:CRAL-TRIO domain-containing protein n=1 Tax=Phaedon cochleariae TaxID=80249 RepID=A0A9N9X111_PHACE|nr:unnamed protein product [Phaedon cochleariae]
MDRKTPYFEDMEKQLELALKKREKSKQDLEEYIEEIKIWLKSQPHLPEMPDKKIIMNFLFMNKFSVEGTKQRLDMYYTKQTLVPEFFENSHPESSRMQCYLDTAYYIPLPKSTEDGYRISVFKLINADPEHFNALDFFGSTYNSIEIRLHEDHFVGEIVIYDLKDASLRHIMKFTPVSLKKAATLLEKVLNNSVQQLHILNYPSYAESLINLVKKLLKPKIAERLHLHQGIDTISEFLPSRLLPEDYNGQERSLKELNELWRKKLSDYRERFDALTTLRVDETKRPTPVINDEILGFHGNFKKLCVD